MRIALTELACEVVVDLARPHHDHVVFRADLACDRCQEPGHLLVLPGFLGRIPSAAVPDEGIVTDVRAAAVAAGDVGLDRHND